MIFEDTCTSLFKLHPFRSEYSNYKNEIKYYKNSILQVELDNDRFRVRNNYSSIYN